ncbi:MAG: sulfotransferase [Acidimicrobiales bacterium]|nr:sulfotransferase [Acidimicrobiales bacterium]
MGDGERSGAQPRRAEWVLAANRGEIPFVAEAAERPLRRDDLLDDARAGLGLDRGAGVGALDGDDAFLEPLDVVLDALETEAALSPVGRWMTRRFLVRLLTVRFQLVAYVAADPGVRDEVITAPVVVTGPPRSGTTVLYELLALDPALRAPEGWELLRPVPPPRADAFPDPGRLALADSELRMMGSVVSGLDAIHVYAGRMPKECLSAMSLAFLSEEFTARYRVPSYVEHLFAADWRPAYEMHRLVLQVLQRRMPGTRWVLKSPVHLHALDALLAVYPDARVAVTHRDPMAVIGSVTSLVANLRWSFSDRVDLPELAAYHVDLYGRSLDRLVDARRSGVLPADRSVHGRYEDFATDPLATVVAVRAGLGLATGPDLAEAMADHLRARPQGAHGVHRYDLDGLDLDLDATRARFARYEEHFAVGSVHPR